MTTTVKRGAGRPAATQRRNRHSQTTPLPPRSEDVSVAREAIADTKPVGKMTMPELREYAAKIGLDHDADGKKITTRTPKGRLLNGIFNWERNRAVREEDTPEVPETSEQAAPSATDPARTTPVPGGLEPRGGGKAEKFRSAIAKSGWEVTVRPVTEGVVEAVAIRGPEVLTIVWDNGVFNYEASGHVIADRTTKVRNVSHARQLAVRSSAEAAAELNKVASNKAWKRKAPDASRPPVALPFDPATVVENEVWSHLSGRRVTWLNRISNNEETARVSREGRGSFRLTEHLGERVVQASTDSGFRAFRLSAIRRISK